MVVVVPTRDDPVEAQLPAGEWRNVLAELAEPYGDDRIAVYERIGPAAGGSARR